MILTDGIHLISDKSLDELHDFAINKLNFKKIWFQDHPTHPHYDLTTLRARKRAIAAGAKLVTPVEIVRICRSTYRKKVNKFRRQQKS